MSDTSTLDKRLRSVLRCVVQVLEDPLTGYFIVHVGQDEMPMEESTQHLDLGLQKEVFSHLTSHGLENDILLTPSDVETISRQATKRARKPRTPSPSFTLPSQRPRPLDGVKQFLTKADRFIGLAKTYKVRQEMKEREKFLTARRLMDRLRLQPHTGRPCLGLLHFQRRIKYSSEQIHQSLWLSDLVHSSPLSESNPISHRFDTIANMRMIVTLFSSLKHFEVVMKAPFAADPFALFLEVATQRVFESLHHNPVLLAVLAVEMITNAFSYALTAHLHRHVDLAAPGPLTAREWRPYFLGEVPFTRFLATERALYRGPIYNCYRFTSGHYFYVQVFATAAGDLLIELKEPTDGRFWANKYRGEGVSIEISRDALRAFVAKVAVVRGLVGDRFHLSLLLLHRDHLLDLLSAIFDTVHVHVDLDPTAGDDLDLDLAELHVPVKVDGMEKVVEINVKHLQEKILKLYRNYNLWVSQGRSNGHCGPIGDDVIAQVGKWAAEMTREEPQWTLRLQRDENNRQVVPIFHSLSPKMLDLHKYHSPALSIEAEGEGHVHVCKYHSFMDVVVRTNTAKAVLIVELAAADAQDEQYAVVLKNEEETMMAEEDSFARSLRRHLRSIDRTSALCTSLRSLAEEREVLASHLASLQRRKAAVRASLSQGCRELSLALWGYCEVGAALALHAMETSLELREGEGERGLSFAVARDFAKPSLASSFLPILETKRTRGLGTEVDRYWGWIGSVVAVLREVAESPSALVVATHEVPHSTSLGPQRVSQRSSHSSASIPRNGQIRTSPFDRAAASADPTGFRDPSHWRRGRFQGLRSADQSSSFPQLQKRNGCQPPQRQFHPRSHRVVVADRTFWRHKSLLYKHGVSGLILFEPDSHRTFQVTSCFRSNYSLYRKCFSFRDEAESETDEVPLLAVVAATFSFAVIATAMAKACARCILRGYEQREEPLATKMSAVMDLERGGGLLQPGGERPFHALSPDPFHTFLNHYHHLLIRDKDVWSAPSARPVSSSGSD